MKFTRWTLINGAVAALAYYGFVGGVEGAANIAMVMLWLTIVISPFALSKKMMKEFRETPAWFKVVDTTYDIAMCAFLLWIGMMWTGVFYMIHAILIGTARYTKESDIETEL